MSRESEDGLSITLRRIQALEKYRTDHAKYPQKCPWCGYEWLSKLREPRYCAKCRRRMLLMKAQDYRTAKI